MRTRLLIAAIALTVQGLAAQTAPILIDHHKPIRLRDGVTVFADVYRPSADGKYPTIVVRTPYGVQREGVGVHDRLITLARSGYAVVNTDVRGRYESEGAWDPFRFEGKDGYDVVEWAAKQPWSTGKVATQGGSYLGHVQWATLGEQPPSLVSAFPAVASTNLYANWITHGGAFRLAFNFGWGVVRMPFRIMQPQLYYTGPDAAPELRYERILRHLPLETMDERAFNHPVRHWRDWLRHESYDEYWKAVSDEERFARVQVPVMTQGGWFDVFLAGTINGYVGVRTKGGNDRVRRLSRMVVGPWGHGPSRKYGDLDFGPDADRTLFQYEQRWHDFHLKGVDNGLGGEAPVQIFYMGINRWRGEADWPIADTRYTPWYLQPGGKLAATAPSGEGSTSYRYDPNDPVPTTGGNNCCGAPTMAGPVDQAPLDARADIVRFTSDPLTASLTIAGPVKMDLHATTDGRDTDWMIKLIDVHPDGKAYPMAEGILRARFRDGLDKPAPLTPGQAYRYSIDMVGTALVFQPGHRIRVDVTSSNFPQFDRNLNTGDPLGKGTQPRVAQQTIHHSAGRPSAIILPVVKGFPGEIVGAGARGADLAGHAPADQPKAFIDGTGPGWRTLGPNDFARVNDHPDTWTWAGDVLKSTGVPIGVIRTRDEFLNFELVVEWRHLKSAGNSGVFAWVPMKALDGLPPGQLPKWGIEVQMLDHGYRQWFRERSGGKPDDWFTTNGDIFPVGNSKLETFEPRSPDGSRSFPRKELSRGVGEWNHYYVRGINGEIRLWVNGEEVSGGRGADPRRGFLCLEAEGAPVEFRNIRMRELP